MGQTRYSRDTWKKNQLRENLKSAPKYGNKACNLCERGRVPDDLSFKVSKYKTCGDVHLELSLINPSQATCEAGQDAYREMCCPKGFQMPQVVNRPALSVTAGLLLFWLFTRHVRGRRIGTCGAGASDGTDNTHNNNGSNNSGSNQNYQRMKDDEGSQGKRSLGRRKRSKSRDSGNNNRAWGRTGSKTGGTYTSATTKQQSNLVTKTFKNKKTGSHNNNSKNKNNIRNESDVLAEQQRKIQQQYMKKQHQLAFGSDADDDQYYHLEDDNTTLNDSTLAGTDTVAGETIDAVITQVV